MHPNTARRRVLLLILPCLVAAAFAAAGLWQPFHPFDIPLLFVNFLCLLCIAPELARAFTEGENRWKACGFIASAAIGAIAGLLNIAGDAAGGAFRFGALSVESWLWLGLFLLSVVSLAVVLLRMLLWDQQQWEQHRLWRQNARNERKEQRRAQRSAARDRNEEARREKQQRKLARIAAARARIAERLRLFREKIAADRERIAAGLALFRIRNAGKLGLFREWLEARRARRSAAEDRREEVKRAKQRRKLERIGSGESVWTDAKGWFSGHGRVLLAVVSILVTLGLFLGVLFTPQLRGVLSGLVVETNRTDNLPQTLSWTSFRSFALIAIALAFVGVLLWILSRLFRFFKGESFAAWLKAHEESVKRDLSGIVVLSLVGLFFAIPLSTRLQDKAGKWFEAVEVLLKDINILRYSDDAGVFLKFANYLIFFILLIVALSLLLGLAKYAYDIVFSLFNKGARPSKRNGLLLDYETPIAVLIVSICVLYAIAKRGDSGNTHLPELLKSSATLIESILLFLIAFVSVELVRIVLEQIGEPDSYLKRLSRLLSFALLDILFEIMLSAITTLNLILAVLSIPELMLPDEWLRKRNKIREEADKFFDKEISSRSSKPSGFSKKTIWRRNRRK